MKLRLGFVVLLAAVLSGCATRGTVQRGTPGQEAGSSGLVPLRIEVTAEEAKAARALTKDQTPNAGNVDAFMTAAQWDYNQGHYAEAGETFRRVSQEGPRGKQALRAQYMLGECYVSDKQFLPALAAFHATGDGGSGGDYARQARQRTEFLVKYVLDAPTLLQFVANYPDSPLRCEALFQVGGRQADMGQRTEAMQAYRDYLAQCPNHTDASDARQMLQTLEAKSSSKGRRIGVLAPLSGGYAGYGKGLTEGIQLALEKVNKDLSGDEQIEVVVRDTAGDPVKAVQAARELIQQEGVAALLGPVAGAESSAVAALANQERVPILCPAATRDTFSSIGPYVFRNSMTNETQGRVLAHYAVDKMGLKAFAVVSPQDAYGEVLASAFRQQAESMGASVVSQVTYPANSTDFRQALTALGGRNPSIDKDNDRENQRREQQLVYALKREFLKASLPLTAWGSRGATTAIAWAPFVEALGSTLCPSVAGFVQQGADGAWGSLKNPLRGQELVAQALTRLPEESRGKTDTSAVTPEQWGAVMDDLQADLLVTGSIVTPETLNPDAPTWNYTFRMETHFRSAGDAKVRTNAVTLSLTEYKKPELTRKQMPFQAVYLPAHTGEIPSLASQLRFYGLKTQFLGGHCWENESVLRDGGDTVEGTVFVSGFWVDSTDGPAKDFVSSYSAKYGRRPDLLAAQSYDALRLLARALRGTQSRDEVRSNLAGINGFDGATGETSFHGTGNADKKVPVLKIEGGKITQLQ